MEFFKTLIIKIDEGKMWRSRKKKKFKKVKTTWNLCRFALFFYIIN